MIPRANITAWRASAAWPDDAQVEQDLVLTRALIEVFSEPKLAGKIAPARRNGASQVVHHTGMPLLRGY